MHGGGLPPQETLSMQDAIDSARRPHRRVHDTAFIKRLLIIIAGLLALLVCGMAVGIVLLMFR